LHSKRVQQSIKMGGCVIEDILVIFAMDGYQVSIFYFFMK